ncbi:succinate semialdehyde dehydrogenase [Caballeronia udeis]|uniref:Succinate semialdehyde dehydrogenase n=1 Tax=Caballeronia udeis TaxID=1232866 RepID=A0A158JIB9_9BURK|nr:NAD-dependent succinate-semialdehyde dehydrogenase [Caballeronia udeis]SAL68622.1 succinate semialdehyde dehydrogenase [Caballeronia udeis]
MNATLFEDSQAMPMLYIGGSWRRGQGKTTTVVRNPASGRALGELGHADARDIDDALASTECGFALWRYAPAAERAGVLRRAADLMVARAAAFEQRITQEQGKPLVEASAEVVGTVQLLRFCSEQVGSIAGRVLPSTDTDAQWEIRSVPVGPCALFSPWNMPLVLTARKVGPALAAGCSAILKPPEEAPSAAAMMVQCLLESGLPPEVLNLLYGDPPTVSSRLIASPVIRKVSLTGSVAVGRTVAEQAAPRFKRLTLELGGHAPVIVHDDVDVEAVAWQCARAKFRNAGQLCLAPSRFFVNETVYERFVARFVEVAEALVVGDGVLPDVEMGPLANEGHLRSVEAAVAGAVGEGALLLCGGRRLYDEGFFYAPTVLGNVSPSMRVMREEPFGPVALMCRVSSLDEALLWANRNPLGLAGYAFALNAKVQLRIQRELDVGALAINSVRVSCAEAPLGGLKDSGVGYESGDEGLKAYLSLRTVHRQI